MKIYQIGHAQVKGGGLQVGYPGLERTAARISEYIPKCKTYVEPFAGLGRVARFVKADKIILNDMSDFAIGYLKSKFPSTTITKEQFADCILKYDSEDTFFFIDPPWHSTDYNRNKKTFCDRGVGEYYKELLSLLKNVKGDWMIAGRAEGGKRATLTVYFNDYDQIVIQGKGKINGYFNKVRLASNKPFVRYNQTDLTTINSEMKKVYERKGCTEQGGSYT
jgi:site-specific DNA-adenine methylase